MLSTKKENFLIVEFSDGLAVVPRTWVNNNKTCWWPNYRNQLRIDKAKSTMEKPSQEWLSYDILKIHTQANNYQEALEKLKLAEDYSDVDQLMGNSGNYKKTRHDRAHRHNSFDSNGEDSADSEENHR
ncbi:PREDICTED: uncharacterized protein LOC105556638 [Vollenhovia emeryi]|uniref:uncharacterized protein LOC105556638 n=1 Tax=Vollenhovia emeryi TaxID=411798 RepID=UPI0005F57069|nr:PREDICTED: uncharacterized protein LOC105556638 [Vollenhovia emeryi]